MLCRKLFDTVNSQELLKQQIGVDFYTFYITYLALPCMQTKTHNSIELWV